MLILIDQWAPDYCESSCNDNNFEACFWGKHALFIQRWSEISIL